MNTTAQMTEARTRASTAYWGLWAERSVVRAMEIDPDDVITTGLLAGRSTSLMALTIARAVGYLAGTQRAPDLDPAVRAWIDAVGMCAGVTAGPRLGAFGWGEWADRAALSALEVDTRVKLESPALRGEDLWAVAITLARAVGCLAGTRRVWALPPELIDWLQVRPVLGGHIAPTGSPSTEEGR